MMVTKRVSKVDHPREEAVKANQNFQKSKQTIIDSLHFPHSVGTDDHFCWVIVVMVDLDCTKFTQGAMLAQDFYNLHSISIQQHRR